MRSKLVCLIAGVGVLLAVTPVSTHHAFSAEFDVDKPLTLTGKLVRWEMINPHSWFHIDIEDDQGTVVTWMIEGGSPNELIRNGVTKNTLEIGIQLTIEGYYAKDGPRRASAGISCSQTGTAVSRGSAPPAAAAR